MGILLYLLIFLSILTVYMNALVAIAVHKNKDLTLLQKVGQNILAWLLPLIGAPVVLFFLYEQTLEPEFARFIPWPFKGFILGKPLYGNGIGSNGEEQAGFHSAGESSGGSD